MTFLALLLIFGLALWLVRAIWLAGRRPVAVGVCRVCGRLRPMRVMTGGRCDPACAGRAS